MTANQVHRRPGGRSAQVRAAVLTATLELLVESGQSGLRVPEVATRAGVHETSIYRRWGTRERLVLDALVARSAEVIPVPDTGSVRGDLIALGERLIEYGSSPLGVTLMRTMAACTDDDAAAATRNQFWTTRFEECRALVERAKARGELAAGVGSRALLEVFISPIHFRLLLTREPVDRKFLGSLADIAIRAVTATDSE